MTIEDILLCKNMNELGKAYRDGLIEGLSGKSKPKPKRQRNNMDHHWKHKKKGGKP